MCELQFPPFLREGDKVAIVSPSGKIDKSFLKGAVARLESWGLKVIMGKHAAGSCGRYAGTVKHRLADLQTAMDDPQIKAIFCSRGGYGAIHLVDKLNFDAFQQSPKWLLGYSDITLLHELFQLHGYASVHSLMARHLAVESESDSSTRYLNDTLWGALPTYHLPINKENRVGQTEGILRGGNLSVLYSMRGTPYDFPTKGTILFLEDIAERPYHIDRMIMNLKLGGMLANLSGLIVGQFTDYDEDKSMGVTVHELIANAVQEYNYPVCFDFPVGHVKENLPLICGAEIRLTVGKKEVELAYLSNSRGHLIAESNK